MQKERLTPRYADKNRILPQSASNADSRLWSSGKATANQAHSWHLAPPQQKWYLPGKELWTLGGVELHVWHWQALWACAARAQDQQRRRRNHPGCQQTAACWSRHTQEGCCCHTEMHETVNSSGLYEMLGWEVGGVALMQGWKCIPWALAFPLGLLPCLSSSPHPTQASRLPHMQRSVNLAGGGGTVRLQRFSPRSDAAPPLSPPIKVNPGWHMTSRHAGNNCFYWCSLMMPRPCMRLLVSANCRSYVSHQGSLWLPSWFCWTGKT